MIASACSKAGRSSTAQLVASSAMHGRGARLAGEQRHLAEHLPGAELGEDEVDARVRVAAPHRDAARQHDVGGAVGAAFAHDDRLGHEVAPPRVRFKQRAGLGGQPAEERHLVEEGWGRRIHAVDGSSPGGVAGSIMIESVMPSGFKTISHEDARRLIASGEVTVLDVRTPGEYAQLGHIPNAWLIPVDLAASAPAVLPGDHKPVLVYCEHGVRSVAASQLLVAAGVAEVLNLAGGLAGWSGPREFGSGRTARTVAVADRERGPAAARRQGPRRGVRARAPCVTDGERGFRGARDRSRSRRDRVPRAHRGADESSRSTPPWSISKPLRRRSFPSGAYDAILVFNYLHRALMPALRNALKPGGRIFYETFTTRQAERGHPTNPDFLLRDGRAGGATGAARRDARSRRRVRRPLHCVCRRRAVIFAAMSASVRLVVLLLLLVTAAAGFTFVQSSDDDVRRRLPPGPTAALETQRNTCPICLQSASFLPAGDPPRRHATCPYCGSLERHRLLYLYLRQKTNLFRDKLSVLHFSPERGLGQALAAPLTPADTPGSGPDCGNQQRVDAPGEGRARPRPTVSRGPTSTAPPPAPVKRCTARLLRGSIRTRGAPGGADPDRAEAGGNLALSRILAERNRGDDLVGRRIDPRRRCRRRD